MIQRSDSKNAFDRKQGIKIIADSSSTITCQLVIVHTYMTVQSCTLSLASSPGLIFSCVC